MLIKKFFNKSWDIIKLIKYFLKIGYIKPETISQGIFVCILISAILNIIISYAPELFNPFNNSTLMLHIAYSIPIIKIVIYLIISKLLCEALYNIVKAAQFIIGQDK